MINESGSEMRERIDRPRTRLADNSREKVRSKGKKVQVIEVTVKERKGRPALTYEKVVTG